MRRSAHEAGDSLSILYPVSWLSWGLKLETGGKILIFFPTDLLDVSILVLHPHCWDNVLKFKSRRCILSMVYCTPTQTRRVEVHKRCQTQTFLYRTVCRVLLSFSYCKLYNTSLSSVFRKLTQMCLRIRLNMYALLFGYPFVGQGVANTCFGQQFQQPFLDVFRIQDLSLSLGRIHFPSSPGIWYHAIRRLPFKFRLDYLKSMFHSIAKI